MSKEKAPITQNEFKRLRDILFLGSDKSIKELGLGLMDFCWELDNWAVSQEWEGKTDNLLVFGVSQEKRTRVRDKNYFSIWRTNSKEIDYLKCEIIVPLGVQGKFLAENNFNNRMHISTLSQVTGLFKVGDYERIIPLIKKAYNYRAKNEFCI